jgi:hypothetical protein
MSIEILEEINDIIKNKKIKAHGYLRNMNKDYLNIKYIVNGI